MARRCILAQLCPLVAGLSLTGCALRDDAPPAVGTTVCGAPRPEVCTMDYRPVCGWREAGSRQTYSNACSACTDSEVVAYLPGACAD